ncbi:hypothetical protein KBD61_06095 [Patescibacteria group bacterium]|nr:hypothetical protein [Patescibacteria group bacterium]MBP9710558.1 hypothetical protein [Patescibacteria group bacterium]
MDSPTFLLSRLPDCEPPRGLFEKTLAAIARAQRRALYTRFSLTISGLMTCMGYGAWQSQAFRAEFQTSAFFGFIQLAISDPDVLLKSFADFSLGLLESLPINLLLFGSISILFLVGTLSMLQTLSRKPHPSFSRLSLH